MKTTSRTLAAAFAVLVAAATGPVHAQPTPALDGQWASEKPEPYGSHYATRSFSFTGSQWRVAYRAYADAQGRQPLFRLDVSGAYALGGPSRKVPDAVEGVFPALQRHITAESDAGVQMFAGMGCKLEKGRETPLLSEGCGFVPGLMQAMGEYDLVSIKDGRLYFGDRTGDLTKARPDKLTPFALVRK